MQEAGEENTIRDSSTTVFSEVTRRGLPVDNSVKTTGLASRIAISGAERLDQVDRWNERTISTKAWTLEVNGNLKQESMQVHLRIDEYRIGTWPHWGTS